MGKVAIGMIRSINKLVIVLLVASVAVCGIVFLLKWEDERGKFPERDVGSETLSYNGEKYVLNKDIQTFLVLGLDQFQGDADSDYYINNKKADFLSLFVIDNNAKRYSMIHINRDTMAEINLLGISGNKVGSVTKQITLAHTYGNGREVSCRNTADSVSILLKGMKVNNYISLTMDSVAVLTDLVGGVEVVVLDDFTGIDDTLVQGEKVLLRGEQALTYVRSRRGMEDPTNIARMNRQKQYISALMDKVEQISANDDQFSVDVALKMSEYMISDSSVNQLQLLYDKLSDYQFDGIKEIKGESVHNKETDLMEFYADDEAMIELVIDLFYRKK